MLRTGWHRDKQFRLVADGRMPPGKLVDGCRVWDRYALDEAFDALPDENGASVPSSGGWEGVR